MGHRPHVYERVFLPADPGESPNAHKPMVTAEIRVFWPAADPGKAREAFEAAVLRTRARLPFTRDRVANRPVDHNGEMCHCDYNPETTDGPQEDCPVHGRPYSYWVRQTHQAEQQLQAVMALCDRWDALSKGETATTQQIRAAAQGGSNG